MPARRFAAISLLSVAAMMLAGTAVPASAAIPATDSITVNTCTSGGGAQCSAADDVGLVSVQILASTALTSVSVDIFKSPSIVLTIGMTRTGGTNTGGTVTTWTVSSRITQQQLAYGNYNVLVNATDAGTSITDMSAGFLDFLIYPTTTLSANPAVFDYAHPSVTLSGTLSYLLPDRTTQTLSGEPVTLFGQGAQWPLTTGTSGAFSKTVDPVPVTGTDDNFVAEPTAPDVAALQSPVASVAMTVDALTVSDKWAASPVRYLQTATLEGLVTFTGGTTPEPVAGISLALFEWNAAQQFWQKVASAVTGADGSYALQFPAAPAKLQLRVNTGSAAPGPYFSSSDIVPPRLDVVVPVLLTNFVAKLSPFGIISASVREQDLSSAYAGPVYLEYSATSTGPWKRLATFSELSNGAVFDENKVAAPLPSAYYRARFVGAKDLDPAVSKVVKLWKYPTKITSFSVSPSTVAKGGHVTVKGRLWRHVGTWKPFGGSKILILFIYRKKVYAYRAEPTTSSAGWFTVRLQALVSAPWFAQYDGGQFYFASASARIPVTVTGSSPAGPGWTGPGVTVMPHVAAGGWRRAAP